MKKVLKNYDYVIKNLKTYMTDNINMTDDKGQQSLIYSILHYKPGKMVFTGEWRI
jgi:hypothetical protein